MSDRLTASVSLDMDDLWSYLKTHGDPAWERRPSYLPALLPRLLEAFAELPHGGSVFVVGFDATRDEGASVVAALSEAGHEIGNHSFEHEPWLHRYSRSRLDDELARTEEALVAAGAPRPVGFRGPGFSTSPELLATLQERGYTYDCSVLPTWIGPLARAYYFRASTLSAEERQERGALFGSARDGLLPVHPFRWEPGGLLEIPVTTMPLARVPIHVSYLVHLDQFSPRLARAYFRAALRACVIRGVGPSLLVHPLDLLGRDDAPGLEFFPGMAQPATRKADLLGWALRCMAARFDLVGVGAHAAALTAAGVPRSRRTALAGPRSAAASGSRTAM